MRRTPSVQLSGFGRGLWKMMARGRVACWSCGRVCGRGPLLEWGSGTRPTRSTRHNVWTQSGRGPETVCCGLHDCTLLLNCAKRYLMPTMTEHPEQSTTATAIELSQSLVKSSYIMTHKIYQLCALYGHQELHDTIRSRGVFACYCGRCLATLRLVQARVIPSEDFRGVLS